jgi:hypothetical protein
MSDREGTGLDTIARDLASGAISRRTALRRFGTVALAGLLPGALFADPALARCPKERRCHGKCCPKHAHCNNHQKCKCNRGYTKCGKHCRDLLTDERNCGSCGHRCPDGKTCRNGHCKAVSSQTCGNGVREGTEQCDGADLGAATCASLGFVSGTLACTGNCTYDTSGCTGVACTLASDCPDMTADCKTASCVSGACQYTDNAQIGQPCFDNGVGACRGSGTYMCNGSGVVVCNITQPGATPKAEVCGNGIDDDCDGTVDNGCLSCVTDTDCVSNHCVNGFCA